MSDAFWWFKFTMVVVGRMLLNLVTLKKKEIKFITHQDYLSFLLGLFFLIMYIIKHMFSLLNSYIYINIMEQEYLSC